MTSSGGNDVITNPFGADVDICRHAESRPVCKKFIIFYKDFALDDLKWKKWVVTNFWMLKNIYSTMFNSKLKFLADTSYLTKSKSLPVAHVSIRRHAANRSGLHKKAPANRSRCEKKILVVIEIKKWQRLLCHQPQFLCIQREVRFPPVAVFTCWINNAMWGESGQFKVLKGR